jgi:hypothetical protein
MKFAYVVCGALILVSFILMPWQDFGEVGQVSGIETAWNLTGQGIGFLLWLIFVGVGLLFYHLTPIQAPVNGRITLLASVILAVPHIAWYLWARANLSLFEFSGTELIGWGFYFGVVFLVIMGAIALGQIVQSMRADP